MCDVADSARRDKCFVELAEDRGLDPDALALAFHALRSDGDPLANVAITMMGYASKGLRERESDLARALRGIQEPAAALAGIGRFLSEAIQALNLAGSLDGDTVFIARTQVTAALDLLGDRELSEHVPSGTRGPAAASGPNVDPRTVLDVE